jgi:DNA-binding NtrC family response regulator
MENETSSPSPPPLTILLAEDDANLRSMLAIVLRRDGHRVKELRDGAELRAHLTELVARGAASETLVVTDLRMPEADGLSLMREFRAQGKPVPFILLTAFGSPELHAAAHALGALAVLDKPFDFDDLRDVVRHRLRAKDGWVEKPVRGP